MTALPPPDRDPAAVALIRRLGLVPHPEGGWYRETWRDGEGTPRGSGTAIYFLLEAHQSSDWHRVDATEIWHHYAGRPLRLSIAEEGKPVRVERLGSDFVRNELPQRIVPKRAWQKAEPDGGWTLVGCTVSPAFEFRGFEMAERGWEPG
jgi:predicted cupin superfamily sugar epimerase